MSETQAEAEPDRADIDLRTYERLNQEVERMQELISRLEEHLAPVLQLPSPNVTPSDAKEESAIRGTVRRFRDQNNRLVELLDRIDI